MLHSWFTIWYMVVYTKVVCPTRQCISKLKTYSGSQEFHRCFLNDYNASCTYCMSCTDTGFLWYTCRTAEHLYITRMLKVVSNIALVFSTKQGLLSLTTTGRLLGTAWSTFTLHALCSAWPRSSSHSSLAHILFSFSLIQLKTLQFHSTILFFPANRLFFFLFRAIVIFHALLSALIPLLCISL